uniref:WAP domain-containing protein n=1 Tax=Junco hyemalis TaxID=40217 RepID=A0A8C5IFS7_JUNHY
AHPLGRAANSAWSCPPVRFTCALHNPPNQCFVDRHCPRGKRCCRTFCGRKCISNPTAAFTPEFLLLGKDDENSLASHLQCG